ncbi:hypothetical protein [Ruegeria lacuscaerulensis]|uniref:hypothetical protein n=1 Tax=Ruegeria lacuscaerulensis TaxID=55218 RepID=UPI0014810885|nr:hypothetical protein [Ruegeria lacuscaerulensis]
MKAWISSTLVAVAVLGAAVASQAKPLSRIIAEMGLSPEDFNVVNVTADAMLAGGAPQVGTESTWANEATGSMGTIRVREVRDNCVHLQHFIQPEGSDQTREVRTRRCRDASGNWILTP